MPEDLTHVKSDPFNHPVEFNAYFQQVANIWHNKLPNIAKSTNPLEEFYKQIGKDARQFTNNFWNHLKTKSKMSELITPERRFKWSKQVYDLYFNLKDKLVEIIGGNDVLKDIKKIVP